MIPSSRWCSFCDATMTMLRLLLLAACGRAAELELGLQLFDSLMPAGPTAVGQFAIEFAFHIWIDRCHRTTGEIGQAATWSLDHESTYDPLTSSDIPCETRTAARPEGEEASIVRFTGTANAWTARMRGET